MESKLGDAILLAALVAMIALIFVVIALGVTGLVQLWSGGGCG